MRQLISRAIILSRTDYGEADRILTLLTPDYGKLRLIARGVRRVKSKLAGGIELFSVSQITFIRGKGEGDMGTLVSTRLVHHYNHIVSEFERTQLAYQLIKRLHQATEDNLDESYFSLLERAFVALDKIDVPLDLIDLWFTAQLLKLAGHMPNLQTDDSNKPLKVHDNHQFNYQTMRFNSSKNDGLSTDIIKLLRLAFSDLDILALSKVDGVGQLASRANNFLQHLAKTFG